MIDLPAAAPSFDDIDGILSPIENIAFFGQQHAVTLIEQMRRENRLHHAILFEGPRGVGKATFAFRLAWNILTGRQGTLLSPDKESIGWRRMVQLSNERMLYISRPYDEKNQRFKLAITVDEVRSISRFLSRTTSDGGWRVVIIDSADDMNRNAANALLKTLEEPPSKTLLLLISHFSGRLLPTIRSRCQSIRFKPLQKEDLSKALYYAQRNESPQGHELISDRMFKKSEGSVRRAALLINFGGLEIMDTVEQLLDNPVLDISQLQHLSTVLSNKDSTVQYQLFGEGILDIISIFAKTNEQDAANWAQIWEMTQTALNDADSFNLDKKQFIIITISQLHDIIWKKSVKS